MVNIEGEFAPEQGKKVSKGEVKSIRITSYNVCYTKLLRFPLGLLAHRADPKPPGGMHPAVVRVESLPSRIDLVEAVADGNDEPAELRVHVAVVGCEPVDVEPQREA